MSVCVGGQRTSKHWENLGSGLIEKMLQSAHNTLLLWHSWPKNVNKREKERDLELETENDGSICVLVCWVCCSACCPSITIISISIIVKRHGHTWNEADAKGASCWHTSLYISTYVIYTHTICLSLWLSRYVCLLYMLKKTLCNNPSVVKQIFTNILQSEETSQKNEEKEKRQPIEANLFIFC